MHRHRPLLGRLTDRQEQRLPRLRVGKSAAGLDDLAQRPVQRFYAVGGPDHLADSSKRCDAFPLPPPNLAYLRIGSPLVRQRLPNAPRLPPRGPNQVHDAELHFRAGKDGLNPFRKSIQPIHTMKMPSLRGSAPRSALAARTWRPPGSRRHHLDGLSDCPVERVRRAVKFEGII